MDIEKIVRAWKSDEENLAAIMPESPVGEELSDKNLEQVVGGMGCSETCGLWDWTCGISCLGVITNTD